LLFGWESKANSSPLLISSVCVPDIDEKSIKTSTLPMTGWNSEIQVENTPVSVKVR
jgi:hypothetical protein